MSYVTFSKSLVFVAKLITVVCDVIISPLGMQILIFMGFAQNRPENQ